MIVQGMLRAEQVNVEMLASVVHSGWEAGENVE